MPSHGPGPSGAPATVSIRSKGASNASCPLARRRSAVRAPSGSGRVTSRRMSSSRIRRPRKNPRRRARAIRRPRRRRAARRPGGLPLRVVPCASLPSGRTISPRKCRVSPRSTAWPPIGVRHEPSSTARKRRAPPRTAACVSAWSIGADRGARVRVVHARLDGERALAGRRQELVGRQDRGRDVAEAQPLQPGEASRMASTSPAASLRSRVSTLPRQLITSRSGRAPACAWRRREAVPSTAPCGKLARMRRPCG